MATQVQFRGNRSQAVHLLGYVVAVIAGRTGDTTGLRMGLMNRVGMTLLSLIKIAFIVKARGGADDAGITWKPLDPKTIAYKRRHPGLTRNPANRRPLLKPDEDRRWRQIFVGQMKRFQREGYTLDEAKRGGAAIAWAVLKREGALTILGVYGNTPVEIGRDTDRMFNSLSPGQNGPSGNPDQTFQVVPGSITVGTNVTYAEHFHKKRPLWPAPDQLPQLWWDDITDAIVSGYMAIFVLLAGRMP